MCWLLDAGILAFLRPDLRFMVPMAVIWHAWCLYFGVLGGPGTIRGRSWDDPGTLEGTRRDHVRSRLGFIDCESDVFESQCESQEWAASEKSWEQHVGEELSDFVTSEMFLPSVTNGQCPDFVTSEAQVVSVTNGQSPDFVTSKGEWLETRSTSSGYYDELGNEMHTCVHCIPWQAKCPLCVCEHGKWKQKCDTCSEQEKRR